MRNTGVQRATIATTWRAVGRLALGASLSALLSASLSATVSAQAFARGLATRATVAADRAADPGDAPAAVRRAPVTTVRAMPRSLHVVAVPVPEAFHGTRAQWRFLGGDLTPVLGERAGRLETRTRDVLFTVRIPASAPAGLQEVGVVRFEAPGTAATDAPLVLDVQVVRRVFVSAAGPMPVVRGGDVATVRFDVHNGGNAPDTLQWRATAPNGWRLLSNLDVPVVLAVGQRTTVAVRIAVPDDAGLTSASVRLQAMRGATLAAEAEAPLEVTTGVGAEAVGPTVTASAVSAPGTQDGLAGWGVRVAGRLTDDISIDAQTSQAQGLTPLGLTAMTRVGFFPMPLNAAIAGPGWRVAGGITGLTVSELAGIGVTGSGVTAIVDGAGPHVQAVAARPWTGALGAPGGGLYAARVALPLGSRRWSVAHADLDEAGPTGRQLVATTLGFETPTRFGGTLDAEVGHRRHRLGSGLGASAEWRGGVDGTDLFVRAGRAPGGTGAFARASEDLSASVSRRFASGIELGIGGFRVRDESPTGGSLRNVGAQLTPRARLGERTWVGLELRTTGFEARGATLGFEDRDLQLGLDVQHQFANGLSFSSQAFGSRIRRATVLADGTRFETEAPRGQLRAALGKDADWGSAEATLLVERSGVGSGLPPSQSALGLRVHNLQPVAAWPSLRVGMDVQRLVVGQSSGALIARADARMQLVGGFRLQAAIERNPLLAVFGAGTLVGALRLERSFGVPMPQFVQPRSAVYIDANANGRRDAGEAGLAGAVVRAGTRRVIADGAGRFRAGAASARDVALDDRSLPPGWSIGAITRDAQTGDVRAVGVVPGAGLDVRVEIVAADEGFDRVRDRDLDELDVYATDGDGRAWLAVPRGGQRWSFTDLPPGTYTLAISSERLPEPVIVRGPPPVVRLDGRAMPAPLVLRVGPRPVRLVPLPSATDAPGPETPGPTAPLSTPPASRSASTAPVASPSAADTARLPRWLVPMPTVSTSGTSYAVLPPASAMIAELPTLVIPRGATLWGLSRRYYGSGAKYPRLMTLNPQIRDPNRIYAGRTMKRPAKTAAELRRARGGTR